jgi:hypothetical protein
MADLGSGDDGAMVGLDRLDLDLDLDLARARLRAAFVVPR